MGLTKNLGWLSKYITADSSGNLGVGVASPLSGGGSAKWLTIDGTTYGGGFISSVNGVSKGTLYYDQASLTFSMYAPAGVGATIHTNGIERMRITSSGSVGINTNSPASASVLTLQESASLSGALSMLNRNGNQRWLLAVDAAAVDDKYLAFIDATTNVPRMVIGAGGNVGIGTTSPTSFSGYTGLTINGTSGGFTQLQVNGANATRFSSESAFTAIFEERNVFMAFGTNNAERMRITSGGNVSIGNQSDTGFKLWVEGSGASPLALRNASATGGRYWKVGPDSASNFIIYNESNTGCYINWTSTSWTGNSDIRLKNIIKNIDNATESLLTLNPVIFSWKTDNTNKENLGLIAQDVEKVFPQVIDSNSDGMLGVRYTDLIPVLIASIQELTERIKTLENK